MAFPKEIITKPYLISNAEYQQLGDNIALVGYDSFSQTMESKRLYASPRLLNWVEPVTIGGDKKTMFYTEVNSNILVGDKVYIISGNYDSTQKANLERYKRGSDGYSVLRVEGCKISLDIDYTGVLPYNEDSPDDFIRVYYIDTEESFAAANRQMTTRGGKLDYKFNYGQNSIAFIQSNHAPMEEWGRNGGVLGAPGFFVREKNVFATQSGTEVSIKKLWSNISDELVYLGSFSIALSGTYKNNGKMLIMNGSFEYGGFEFREGVAYSWNATASIWIADSSYSVPVITKSNFRGGRFDGKFSSGVYGSIDRKMDWTGKGTWTGGTLLNSRWVDGEMESLNLTDSYKAEKDEYGIPLQRPNTSNNGGYGFNYIINSDIERGRIHNGNFFGVKFAGDGTFSVVEDHILAVTQSYDSEVEKAFFHSCEFRNVLVKGGEINNARAYNSKFSNIKSVNSQFENSIMKDSTYVGDAVIKILGYDEWNMSEYNSRTSGTYSYIASPNSKIYKFYISKESFYRLKAGDVFYIKGIKINAVVSTMPDGFTRIYGNNLLNFFDGKFRLASWTQYYDDASSGNIEKTKVTRNSFYKRGFECSAFLSTPEDNSYIINSYEEEYNKNGLTYSKYRSVLVGTNSNKGYSIDIVASRHDLFNKINSLPASSDSLAQIPRDFNYDTEIEAGKIAMSNRIGDVIDIGSAYVIDADFESGIIETSDWNSGYHINYANDVAICGPTSTGHYNISIDSENDYLIIDTTYNDSGKERLDGTVKTGDIIFLNSVDYDNRGMAETVTMLATGSGYITTSPSNPARLVNTIVNGTTMSSPGSAYSEGKGISTITRTGNGTGLTVDIETLPVGSVISITYSAPISNGGSYSINFTSTVSTTTGPIDTTTFVENVVTDDAQGTATGISAAMNGGINATYSIFGPLQIAGPGSGSANAIYDSGPVSNGEGGLILKYYTLSDGSISSLQIEEKGYNYLPDQVFKIEGGNATFSIASVSFGEITSYSVDSTGEDYRIGDILDIIKPYDPNQKFEGTTASIVITAITASYHDTKGLRLDITADGTGGIVGMTVSNSGRQYFGGEIFTIDGGNLDAQVRIDSVTGSNVSLPDTYKVVESRDGTLVIRDMATQSIVTGLTGGGVFYTEGGYNRWNYLSKTKIDRTKIKSGIFRRPYLTKSLIRDIDFNSSEYHLVYSVSKSNYSMLKNTMFVDTIFRSNGNILSSAMYVFSNFVGGSDIWNDGFIFRSCINGITFSKGTVNNSTWLAGTFNGGIFYESRSFDAEPNEIEKDYLANSRFKYFMSGEVKFFPLEERIWNSRDAWYSGTFNGGTFYKSDWNSGTFNGGTFKYSNFYDGVINGGKIGDKRVSADKTRIYNATINDTTVEKAYVYAEDTSYEGQKSQMIEWNGGTFNGGIFGSKNDALLGSTESNTTYSSTIGSLPIKDLKIAMSSVSVTDITPLSTFDIDATITIKHTYIGDVIVNLMAPNGKIINLKKRYAGGASDGMIDSVFTTEEDSPSIDIWSAPYTGKFKMAAEIGQGAYYTLSGLATNTPLRQISADIAPIKSFRSIIPTNKYDGDRYLVVATASDPTWSGETTGLFVDGLHNQIVEWDSQANGGTGAWILRAQDTNKSGNRVYVSSSGEYLIYVGAIWLRSYHSDISDPNDLLNSNKTATGTWKLIVMDDSGTDSGFVEKFSITLKYKSTYVIQQYNNTAIWRDGVFNGGQFADLAIWKKGKFNGGKFISTYGWTQSGNFLNDRGVQDEYSWQDGEFNGGEFGTGTKDANSTWYKGEFNGGVFKGRLWNDGVFAYGEFKGSSTLPAAGGKSLKSEAAGRFIEAFRTGRYYGVWRKGLVSEKKGDFLQDKKIFTAPERASKPIEKGKKSIFTNILWIGGIFDHQSGEMRNSVWMDGLFRRGRFDSGSFNPYITRQSDTKQFLKDDSCIWENGTLINSEFHYSKWMQGRFISGTAVGMIWKDGIANYMNAYNVFWEDGIWRNGNWHGSAFEYSGKVDEVFDKEILNRGIQWSATSSCHIWNMFEIDSDKTKILAISNYNITGGKKEPDTFATDNVDDAGIFPPSFSGSTLDSGPNSISRQSTQFTFNFAVSKGTGTMSEVGIAWGESNSANVPEPYVSSNIDSSGNIVVQAGAGVNTVKFVGDLNLDSISASITVTGLNTTKYYSFRAYAVNKGGVSFTDTLSNVRTIIPLGSLNAQAGTPASPHPTTTTPKLDITTSFTDPNSSSPGNISTGIVWSKDVQNGSGLTIGANNTNNTTVDTTVTGAGTSKIAKTSIYYSDVTKNPILEGNTTYYFRTWVDNVSPSPSSNISYSSMGTFKTGPLTPVISTFIDPAGAVTNNLSMTFVNNGSTTVKYGFILSIINILPAAKAAATLAQTPVNGVIGTNTAIIYLQGTSVSPGSQTITLPVQYTLPGKTYKVVAYVVDIQYTTLLALSPQTGVYTLNTVATAAVTTTLAATVITSASATLNGNISSDGGSTITYRGFLYRMDGQSYPSIPPVPVTSGDLNNGIIVVVGTTGNFSGPLSAINAAKKYFFKSFCINGVAPSQGTELEFTTLP